SSGKTKMRTLYQWKCACGAHSRGGKGSQNDAVYNAQRHQLNMGIGHPMPEIYPTTEEVPADWP
ncbi:hypothetical protein ACTXIU_01235, partial [Glutamicibacter arilaitensis]